MLKRFFIYFCVMFILTAAQEPNQVEIDRPVSVRDIRRNNKKLWAQGCLIGGAVILIAGLGAGGGVWIDRSDASTNQDVDIDLYCKQKYLRPSNPPSMENNP